MTDSIVARVNAFEKYQAAYYAMCRAKAEMEAALAPCPAMTPPTHLGHWRDWHAGHGCEADIRGNLEKYREEIRKLAEEMR